jgi:hypothetical protein
MVLLRFACISFAHQNKKFIVEKEKNIMKPLPLTTTETQYRGLAKNLLTKQYDELFNTNVSELLCNNRTVEAAEIRNNYSNNGIIYDVIDIIVQSRTVETYATDWK